MSLKKIFCCICSMLFISMNALFAVMLPDGTDAMISRVEKYPRGKIKSIELSEPAELNTDMGKLTFTSTAEFYENGKVKSGDVERTKIKMSIGEFEITGISFYESGKIM